VFSVQARRALFQSLDLIPPQYTYEACSAAARRAAKGSGELPSWVPPDRKRQDPAAGKHQAESGSRCSTEKGVRGSRARSSCRSGPGMAGTSLGHSDSDIEMPEAAAEAARASRGRQPVNYYQGDTSSDGDSADERASSSSRDDAMLLCNEPGEAQSSPDHEERRSNRSGKRSR
jgi:hypothetical protein